jgi:hypothetical protein
VVGSYPIEALLLLLPLVVASALDVAWGALGRAGIGAVALGGFFLALALVYPGQLGMGDPLTDDRTAAGAHLARHARLRTFPSSGPMRAALGS